ncbi:MAG: ABC transporter ATP-binding protein [Myxococcota bacterium]
MGVDAETASAERRPLLRLFALAWEAAPSRVVAVMSAALVGGIAPPAIAWVSQQLIDAVDAGAGESARNWLVVEAVLMLLIVLGARISRASHSVLAIRLGDLLRGRMLRWSMGLTLDEVSDEVRQSRLDRARRQVRERPSLALQHALGVARDALVFGASASLLVAISPVALAAVVLTGVPLMGAQLRYARRLYELTHRQTVARREQGYLENVLTRERFAAEVRAHGFGEALCRRHERIGDAIRSSSESLLRSEARVVGALGGAGVMVVYACYVGVVAEAASGRLSVGALAMALVALRQTQSALRTLAVDGAALSQDRLHVADMLVMATKGVNAYTGAKTSAPASGELRFEDVSYRYPDATKDTLRNISFRVLPGEVLGLVGMNGAGKTTLLHLALGLIEPTRGRVAIGGVSPGELSPEGRASLAAVVFQDFARYKLGVDDVIALGDGSKDKSARRRAAERAQATFIQGLPKGFETRLGRTFPGGVDLSGGEWQKLALARALLRDDARLRIFDEATSALDAESEARVFADLVASREGRVTLVAAHRLYTLHGADQVLVLEDGAVAERGKPEELLRGDGPYARWHAMQSRGLTAPD